MDKIVVHAQSNGQQTFHANKNDENINGLAAKKKKQTKHRKFSKLTDLSKFLKSSVVIAAQNSMQSIIPVSFSFPLS